MRMMLELLEKIYSVIFVHRKGLSVIGYLLIVVLFHLLSHAPD